MVAEPGQHAGASADAAVTATEGVAIAVHAADCAPVLFEAPGAVGVAHAGWRGLAAGVIEATVEAMTGLGHRPTTVRVGPFIRPRCYEFDGPELHQMTDRFGPDVRSTTSWGTPAVDLAAGIRSVVRGFGLDLDDDGTCTACSPHHWSHRARGDVGRQALVAWIGPPPGNK